MHTHTAQRIVDTDPAHLTAAIDAFVARTWGPLATMVAEVPDGQPRTFGIRADVADPAPDVWLTFRAEPAGDRTRLRISLDELDPGPDPGLERVLDVLVAGQQV